MTAGFLDTNILIGFFQGSEPVRRALERFDRLAIPAMAYAEFMVGMKNENRRVAADAAIASIFEIVHTTQEICLKAAEIRRETRFKMPDAMIYATAQIEDGTLITFDKDFDKGWADVYIPV